MDYFAILILDILQQKRYKNLGNFMKYFMLCLFFVPICVHASNSSTVHFHTSLRPHVPSRDVGLPKGGTIYAFGRRASDSWNLPRAPWNQLPTLDKQISSIIGPRETLQRRRRHITNQDILNFRFHRAHLIAKENEQIKRLNSKK